MKESLRRISYHFSILLLQLIQDKQNTSVFIKEIFANREISPLLMTFLSI